MIYGIDNYSNRVQPVPISDAERVLIVRHEAKYGINHIATGVSGQTIEQVTSSACAQWRGRGGQSAATRMKNAMSNQLYRRLFDEEKTEIEIAAIVGVARETAYRALLRMGLKIRPRRAGPGDA